MDAVGGMMPILTGGPKGNQFGGHILNCGLRHIRQQRFHVWRRQGHQDIPERLQVLQAPPNFHILSVVFAAQLGTRCTPPTLDTHFTRSRIDAAQVLFRHHQEKF